MEIDWHPCKIVSTWEGIEKKALEDGTHHQSLYLYSTTAVDEIQLKSFHVCFELKNFPYGWVDVDF